MILLGKGNYCTKAGYKVWVYHVYDKHEVHDDYIIHGAVQHFDDRWVPTRWDSNGIASGNYPAFNLSLWERIEPSTQYIKLEKPLKIFLDLDGVCANLDGFFEKHFSTRESLTPKEFWGLVGTIDNFFYHLEPMPKYRTLFTFLKAIPNKELCVLTGTPIPKGRLASSAADKTRWVHKYLSTDIEVLTVCGGANKYKFIEPDKTCLLIDDLQRNIDNWVNANGIGILHTSVESTIEQVTNFLQLDKKKLDFYDKLI